MKPIVIILSLVACCGTAVCQTPEAAKDPRKEDTVNIMFWNLENFFDSFADSIGSGYDAVFTATGERRWTYRRFMKKCSMVAKSILWCSSNQGAVPDIIGVAEIENRHVLASLLKNTILEKLDYRIVHYESPDRRGIDVGLIYRKSRLKLLSSRPVKVQAVKDADTLKTRDILVADFITAGGRQFTVTVNHHPSKFGGGNSNWRRAAALDALAAVADSASAKNTAFVAMGDFNDTPEGPAYSAFCKQTGLCSLALPLWKKGIGTIRYNGRWELIDHFYVSPGPTARMEIIKIPFLLTRDNVHSGDKPKRTYVGPRYAGGVSDHLPIMLQLEL